MRNKLTIIIPLGETQEDIFNECFNSLIKEAFYIERVIVVFDVNIDYENRFLSKAKLLGNQIDFEFLGTDRITTKMQKLSISSNLIDDESNVLVLDADDILLFPERVMNNRIDEFDITLFPYVREDNIDGKSDFMQYTKDFVWSTPWKGYPYFGNHATLIKGKIFKDVQERLINDNFQRNEDVFRTYKYLELAKNIQYLNENNWMIKRRILEHRNHALKIKDWELLIFWMNNLIENIDDDNSDLIEKDNIVGIEQIDIVKSINASKYEIAKTLYDLEKMLTKNKLSEKAIKFMEKNILLINKYMQN